MLLPSLSVVTPAAPLLDAAAVKAHLRIDTADDDGLIADLVAAVTADLDAATGWLGRALGQQTLKLTASHFPGCGDAVDWRMCAQPWATFHPDEIRLPCPPVQSVTGVSYVTAFGGVATLPPPTYALSDRVLFPVGGASWPITASRPDAVSITYVAGYAPGTLPAPIRQALLLKVGALYANRNDSAAVTDLASDRLLSPWRVFA